MDSSSSSSSMLVGQILNSWAENCRRQPTSDCSDLSRDPEAREQIQSLLSEELEQVTALDVRGTEAADSEIAIAGLCVALQQRLFPRLLKLNLCNCRVDRSGLTELAQAVKLGSLANLTYLGLSESTLDDVGAVQVAAMLTTANLPSLDSLHLLRTDVSDVGLMAIADALKSGRVNELRSLSVGSVKQRLTTQGTSALGKSFQSLPHLENLQMQGIVDEEAVIAVVEELNSGMVGRIKSLEFSYCGIGTEGAKAIAGCLESLNLGSLESLDLSNNLEMWMGDEGVIALARALKTIFLYNLRKLALNNVAMGEKGLLELAALLEGDDLPGLQELHVRDSGNTETSARALLKAYQANPFLTAEIFVSWPDPSFEINATGFRRQNLQSAHSLKLLMDEPNVQGTRAKIFICGHPKVGKTTVKNSLSRPHSKRSGRVWPKTRVCTCSKIDDDKERAFEIELFRHVHRNLFLGLWDVAGQPEQLLHPLNSSSLPHLAFSQGQTSLFVIVCSANYYPSPDMNSNEDLAKEELRFWLRYIASNSVKTRDSKADEGKLHRRHVVVVLNSFHGEHSCHSKIFWNEELRRCQELFQEFLLIHCSPFIVDFHNRKEAKTFKHNLSKRLKDLLRVTVPVPRLCSEVQQRISKWVKKSTHHRCSVLSWNDFRSRVLGSKGYLRNVSENSLRAATEYLHETGQIIYFREGVLIEGGMLESPVILDPALFCQTIFRLLLMPDSRLRKGEPLLRANLRSSGALPIELLQAYISNHLSDPAEVRHVISLFVPLGLAYKFRSQIDHIFIPALFENDNVPTYWDFAQVSTASKCHWIMGFALKVARTDTTLLPISVFRKFQMELAQEQDEFDSFSSCEFNAGKNFVTFRNPEMAVAVQYRGDPLNRLDFLTKPEPQVLDDRNGENSKESQVNLAQAVLEKFELIANRICPGIEFSRRVIEPWSSEYGLSKTMENRNVETPVEEVKSLLKKGGVGARTNMMVRNEPVFAIQALSSKDIKDLRLSTKEECVLMEQSILHPELFAFSVDPSIAMYADSIRAKAKIVSDSEEERVTKAYTLEKFFSRRVDEALLDTCKYNNHPLDNVHQRVNDSEEQMIQRQFDHRESLGSQIQKCVRYTLAQQESSMPRYLYLVHREDGSSGKWMKLEYALLLRQSCTIHFLCENRALHEVREQQGLELSQLKELGDKLAPLLEWTFKMAFLTCKIGRSAQLPGLELMLRDAPTSASKLTSTGQLAKISNQLKNFASAATPDILKAKFPLTHADPGGFNPLARTDREVASARAEITAAFKALVADMTPTEVMQKVGLKRVMLSTSEPLWTCRDCYSRYGSPTEI